MRLIKVSRANQTAQPINPRELDIRVLGDSGRSRVAFGLAFYVLFVLAVALRLGILPDESTSLRKGRASLCEAVAVNSAVLLGHNDLVQLESILGEIVRRDEDLESAGIRLADGDLLIEAGAHQTSWLKLDGAYSTDTQVQVPLGNAEETWGSLELRFQPMVRQGSLQSRVPPMMQLLLFVGAACFLGFRSFLSTPRVSATGGNRTAQGLLAQRSVASAGVQHAPNKERTVGSEFRAEDRPSCRHSQTSRPKVVCGAGFSWGATWIGTEDWGEMIRDQQPPADDERESTRFGKEPETDYAVLWRTPGDEMLVSVHDESLGGLSLMLPEAPNLQVGNEVDIVYAGSAMRGTIKHVQPQPDGTFLVGFQCRTLS